MFDQTLCSSYFIASSGAALSCLMMFNRRMAPCGLLSLSFLISVFGVTFISACLFSVYGVKAGILFSLPISILIPLGRSMNLRGLHGEENGRTFQFFLGGILLISAIVMNNIIGTVLLYLTVNCPLLSFQQWFSALLLCNLLVGIGGVLICIDKGSVGSGSN